MTKQIIQSAQVALLSLVFGSQVFAAKALEKVEFQGEDISSVIETFRPYMHTLKKPVVTFNWSQNRSLGEGIESLNQIKQSAELFWQKYEVKDLANNDVGIGLYAALDPVISSQYGGDTGNWRLTQITMPVGFKFFDMALGERRDFKSSEEFKNILEKFECRHFDTTGAFFRDHASGIESEKCLQLGRFVFQNYFKIDGFSYKYKRSSFYACSFEKPTGFISSAIVFTTGHWMSPKNVQFFTQDTLDRKTERMLIQSQFFRSKALQAEEVTDLKTRKSILNHVRPVDGVSVFDNPTVLCGDKKCSAQTQKMSEGELIGNPYRYLEFDRNSQAEVLDSANIESKVGFLWPDLEGSNVAPTDQWIRNSQYACDGKLPY